MAQQPRPKYYLNATSTNPKLKPFYQNYLDAHSAMFIKKQPKLITLRVLQVDRTDNALSIYVPRNISIEDLWQKIQAHRPTATEIVYMGPLLTYDGAATVNDVILEQRNTSNRKTCTMLVLITGPSYKNSGKQDGETALATTNVASSLDDTVRPNPANVPTIVITEAEDD